VAAPKPRPANLRLLEGRGNGRDVAGRIVKPAPGFVRLPPIAPEFLTGEARRMWDLVVPELQRLQLLKPIDEAALSAFCLTWERMCTAQARIAREGMILETERGPVKSPAVLIVEAASKELRAWSSEFGLTPSSESRLGSTKGADGDEDENPFAA
jgi:P27 family predicted phage terminase small subunit